MNFDDCSVVLDRQDDGSWVAEITAAGGCYASMDTREAALEELRQVFDLIALEHHEDGLTLPTEPIEIRRDWHDRYESQGSAQNGAATSVRRTVTRQGVGCCRVDVALTLKWPEPSRN